MTLFLSGITYLYNRSLIFNMNIIITEEDSKIKITMSGFADMTGMKDLAEELDKVPAFNLDVEFDSYWPEFTLFWPIIRVITMFFLCGFKIFNMERRYVKSKFALTIFPPGDGTLRPQSVGRVGRFLSLWELATSHRWTKGNIFIGRPLPEQRMLGLFNFVKVGSSSKKRNAHMLTIAPTQSGKGTAVIIPNLIHYPGSVIAIDPKGELAAITASRRGFGSDKVTQCLKQRVYVFDPENTVKNHKSCCWNPFDELDLYDSQLWATIERIATVLIPLNDDSEVSFFCTHARTFLIAVIAYVLEVGPEERRNLIHVRKLIMEGDIEYFNLLVQQGQHVADPQEALLILMSQSSAQGGKIARTASSFKIKAPETKTSIMGTLEEHTAFLDHPGLEQTLQNSDFHLADIKRESTTLYLCIKDTSLKTPLVKVLTLFIDLAIVALAEDSTQKPKHNVLFILDEFPILGKSESIETGMGLLAGYGITLWPIIQNISQLMELYPQTYHTFLTNTRGIQFFGDQEEESLKYIEKHGGKRLQQFPDGSTREIPLLEVNSLQTDFFNQEDRRQIYISKGRPVALLELVDYFKSTKKALYHEKTEIEHPNLDPKLSYINPSKLIHKPVSIPDEPEQNESHTVQSAERIETGFILYIDHLRSFELDLNDELTVNGLPEIEPISTDDLFAKVITDLKDQSLFMLKNLSRGSWFLDTKEGVEVVETYKSITLKDGIKFSMGPIEAQLFESPLRMLPFDGRRIFVLNQGRAITDTELSELMPSSGQSNIVAQVVSNPKNKSQLGLKNCSQSVWDATNASGEQGKVAINKSIVLKPDVIINFGKIEAKVII